MGEPQGSRWGKTTLKPVPTFNGPSGPFFFVAIGLIKVYMSPVQLTEDEMTTEPNPTFEIIRADEVAECWDGVSETLYRAL